MMRLMFGVLLFLAALILVHIGLGSALHIEIDPQEVNGYVHDHVTVTCGFDKASDNAITEVFLVQLSKNDIPVAILRQNSFLTVTKSLGSRIQAKGNISKVVTDSYLQVTVTSPQKEDVGRYRCLYYYLGKSGGNEDERAANLTMTNYDMNSTLRFLYDRVALLEQKVLTDTNVSSSANDAKVTQMDRDHVARLAALEKDLTVQKNLEKDRVKRETDLVTNLSRVSAKLKEQDELLGDQTKLVNQLNDRVSAQEKLIKSLGSNVKPGSQSGPSHVNQFEMFQNWTLDHISELGGALNTNASRTEYFMARHNKSGYFTAGSIFIYADVIVQEGQGYNPRTGIFTAPVAGYYMFHLSINAYANSWVYIDLNSSNGQIFLRLFAGDHQKREDFAHGSAVVKLKAGEEVKPVIFNADGNYAQQAISTIGSGRVNHFSGYLLKAV